MSSRFITRLPREAQGKAFRVIADDGGYGASMADLERRLETSHQATFEITAQRDFRSVFMRVTVERDLVSRNGVSLRFDGAIGELLDYDGQPTGKLYEVLLSINPSISQAGETVGVLRMRRLGRLPKAS